MLLRNSQCGLNLGEERGDGEPDEEGSEESHPGAVEGAHMWPRYVAKYTNLVTSTYPSNNPPVRRSYFGCFGVPELLYTLICALRVWL